MFFEGGEEARRRVEAGDVVVGRVTAVGGGDRRHLEYMCCCVLVRSVEKNERAIALPEQAQEDGCQLTCQNNPVTSWSRGSIQIDGGWTEGVV